jgi:hypothetical protein
LGGIKDIQTRGKTITTTDMGTKNNTQTPGYYSIKNSKRGILNYIFLELLSFNGLQ